MSTHSTILGPAGNHWEAARCKLVAEAAEIETPKASRSKGAATFQKLGVSIFLARPKRAITAVKGVEGTGMGRGVPSIAD